MFFFICFVLFLLLSTLCCWNPGL
uniref:Uncharacterized protein n=1 Tax=Rhizophora mucronata TaxID=61149 RepID=A0A2P2MX70_RHIMU